VEQYFRENGKMENITEKYFLFKFNFFYLKKNNMQGIYEFPDGTLYEGEWKDHKMHGEGYFIDK
jgi:hypothetical protein